jgi:hypothetical protein
MNAFDCKVETLPNPFEGVNTHLLINLAYVIGIVPFLGSPYTDIGRGQVIERRILSHIT